jgi:hypothetical protein
MRDRHLAIQARSAQLYGKYVTRAPSYFRRSGDANRWVELHWYADKAECQKVAQAVADDLELARLWREFQETLDADDPPTLEEYGEYELPRPVSASPFAQPPIDVEVVPVPRPAPAANTSPSVTPAAAPPSAAAPSGDNGDGRSHETTAKEQSDAGKSVYESPEPPQVIAEPLDRPAWPQSPLPAEDERDALIIEDDPPADNRRNSLSFNDGVWIVDPPDNPGRRDNG